MLEIYQKKLAVWQERIRDADAKVKQLWNEFPANLLESSPAGASKGLEFNRPLGASITGMTREQLGPALHDLTELWRFRTRVTKAIEEANALYQQAVNCSAFERMRHPELEPCVVAEKLEELLRDKPVLLPAIKVDKPAGTFGAIGQSGTAQEYWTALEEAYSTVNNIINGQVLPVFDRWTDSLVEAARELRSVKDLAAEVGETPANLAFVEAQLEAWRAKVFDDPLGAANLADPSSAIKAALASASRELHGIISKQATFATDLLMAKTRLASLACLREAVSRTYKEANVKIKSATSLVVPDDDSVVEDLKDRLGNIEAAGAQQPRPAIRALNLWNEQIAQYELYLRQAAQKNRQPVSQRNDMRSEYGAHAALAERFKSNPQVTELAANLKAVLWTRPIDLAHARQLLNDFEQLIDRMIQ